jgi:hypothetical protein
MKYLIMDDMTMNEVGDMMYSNLSPCVGGHPPCSDLSVADWVTWNMLCILGL